MKRLLVTALAAAALAGCRSGDSGTSFVVTVWSDLQVPQEMDAIEVTADDGKFRYLFPLGLVDGGRTLPVRVALVPTGKLDRSVDVRAAGLRGGNKVISQAATVTFIAGEARELVLFLERSCLSVPACPEGRTCQGGECVPQTIAGARQKFDPNATPTSPEPPVEPAPDAPAARADAAEAATDAPVPPPDAAEPAEAADARPDAAEAPDAADAGDAEGGQADGGKMKGAACGSDGECASGTCLDGVCCTVSSCGQCQNCGVGGACVNVVSGTDDTTGTTCTGTNTCDGAGACKKKLGQACVTGADCISQACASGICCAALGCEGPCKSCATGGTCTILPAGPSAGCTNGAVCDGAGVCKKTVGSACSGTVECTSGFCVDGVCCDTACTTACYTCHLSGKLGTCSPSPAGSTDNYPAGACPSPKICDGKGGCGSIDGTSCFWQTDCHSGLCCAEPGKASLCHAASLGCSCFSSSDCRPDAPACCGPPSVDKTCRTNTAGCA